ncbi:MAG: prephenate dehydrogenase [Fusobacteriaceae bacterium]|jgi:prephenate dehydrogenase|nr:prephenate dehydrogenase [Fusobacteriaceae bacterium]MBP6466702.1 prephenate dehydrogenase [Fusobacteriaceae bacterium]MBP9595496.1 prephenate dehydrogenase [Fusobacteriaceae bacterium]MBU9917067.1 prephenate dehydrogenase [Fusobacteriaceae bacterium]
MNICIIGLGLVGGTYALALRENPKINKIAAIDINQEAINKAIELGIIDNGGTDSKDFLPEADLVIISLYPKLILDFIKDNLDNFKKGAIITDAAGVKKSIMDEVNKIPLEADFIFGHPMAGREKIGLQYADKNIFKNANYILTPNEKNKSENIATLKEIIYSMGFKNVSEITADAHDEIISFTSQLTHAIAVALVNSDNMKFDTNRFVGDSYRDLTRIAKINSKLWSELFLENKENLIHKIDAFQEKMEYIKNALLNDDADALEKEFQESTKRRELID